MRPDEYAAIFTKISGEILRFMTSIEMAMAIVIAKHFCSDENRVIDLTSIINDKIRSFEIKKQLVFTIIKKHHSAFEKKHPQLMSNINDMQKVRNKLAHAQMRVPNDLIDKTQKILEYLEIVEWPSFND